MGNFKDIEAMFSNIENMLGNIEQHLIACKILLTFDEAAQYTGLSKSYLYKLTSAGQIPHYKPNGKQIYFHKGELDTWLLRGKVKTNQEIENEAATYVTINKVK